MEEEYYEEEFYDGEIREDDIYSKEGIEELEEEDAINPEEEGFMQGYNEAATNKKKKKRISV